MMLDPTALRAGLIRRLRVRLRSRPRQLGYLPGLALRVLSPHERLWQERSLLARQQTRDGVANYGLHTFGDPLVIRYDGDDARVFVDRFSSIGEGVEFIVGGNHRLDWVSTYPFRVAFGLPGAFTDGHPWSKGDIHVGSDVWVGRQATVLSGVRIGHGAVVAARAVVTTDVPPYAVVAGNPARIVKYRADPSHIEQLLAISWWDWPEAVIRERIADLNGLDHGAFIAQYGSEVEDGG